MNRRSGRTAPRIPEEDEGYGPGGFSPFGPSAEFFADFAKYCRRLGIDPKKVIKEAARESGTFQLPPPGGSKSGWKNWTRSDGRPR